MWSDGTYEEEKTELPYYLTAVGGILLIFIGVFFTKGKRQKQKLIRQGMKQLKKK